MNYLKVVRDEAALMPISPTQKDDIAWQTLTHAKRKKALMIQSFLQPAIDYKNNANEPRIRPVVEYFHDLCSRKKLPDSLLVIASTLARKGQDVPSKSTMRRWLSGYLEKGLLGLVPKHKGSKRKDLGCEARIRYLLRMGSKNNAGNITKILQQEGYDIEYSQTKRFIDSLPANEGMNNRGRLGELKYDTVMRNHVHRHLDNLAPGECYQSDGNMMPIYLQHPTGSRPARYEITPVIDVKSRYIVGYHLSDFESAVSTLHALTDSIIKQDHVPVDFQSDNGPGFKNALTSRFYQQLGIHEAHSRARNPKDNGYIERFHSILKDEFLKKYPAYCGKDAAPESLKLYLSKVDKGEKQLMSLVQFKDRLDEYIYWYNHKRKHGQIGNKTPAELWQKLEKNPPVDIKSAFFWDQKERVVQRSAIAFANREYYSDQLIQYNKQTVIIEYNLYDDTFIKVRDLDERWLCDAKKINAAPYRPQSVIEDRKEKSLAQKRKRLQLKMDEVNDRAALSITHEKNLDALELLTLPSIPVEQKTGTEVPVSEVLGDQANNKIRIDPYDTSYQPQEDYSR